MFRPSSSKHKALNAALRVFEELADNGIYKPLKYTQIATLAGSKGWSHSGKQSAAQVMYEALKDGIDEGDKRFSFHGRGYFSLTAHGISNIDLPEYAAVKRLGRKTRQERSEELFQVQRWKNESCGSCQFIKFNGIKEVTMEGGICMHAESGRCGVKSNSAACPFWVQRSDKQIRVDRERKILMETALNMIKTRKANQPKAERAGKIMLEKKGKKEVAHDEW